MDGKNSFPNNSMYSLPYLAYETPLATFPLFAPSIQGWFPGFETGGTQSRVAKGHSEGDVWSWKYTIIWCPIIIINFEGGTGPPGSPPPAILPTLVFVLQSLGWICYQTVSVFLPMCALCYTTYTHTSLFWTSFTPSCEVCYNNWAYHPLTLNKGRPWPLLSLGWGSRWTIFSSVPPTKNSQLHYSSWPSLWPLFGRSRGWGAAKLAPAGAAPAS